MNDQPFTKANKRALNRVFGGLPPMSKSMRRAAHHGWLAALKRLPESSCPIKDGYLRYLWFCGYWNWSRGIGPLPDERPPRPKRPRRLACG